jgi:hypothetical protein
MPPVAAQNRRYAKVASLVTRAAKAISAWPKAPLPLVTVAIIAWLFGHPGPMLVNLGAGDEPLARGFQEWERAGPEGRTMFRWSQDGATLELPVEVRAEALSLRVRMARFRPEPIELLWRVNGRDAARQTVTARGWHVETLDIGSVEGPLVIEIRSPQDPAALGAAIDWVEISGARRVFPRRGALLALLAVVAGLPVMAHLIAGTWAAHALAALLLLAVPSVLHVDPAQGLVAILKTAPAALVVFAALALMSRFRPGLFQPAFAVGAMAATLASLLLFHPAFYYPDVDTHARLLWSIRQDPRLALDPTPYQQKTGAWTRSIGGEKVAFPYAPAFHVAAVPLAWAFGDTDAIKIAAALALGASALLVHALGRALGLSIGWSIAAQAFFVSMPVESSRLFLALFPTLMGQALELMLWIAIVRRLPSLSREGTLLLGGLTLLTQLCYIGSLVNVAATLTLLVGLLWAAGDGISARRLAAAGTISTLAVGLLLYARFIPVYWAKVLPHAAGAEAASQPGWDAMMRAPAFFGLYLLAAAAGARLSTDSFAAARQVLAAAALAGLGLLALRALAPAAVRDVKEIELLAAPIALFSAGALRDLAGYRRGRAPAAILVGGLVAWGLLRGAHAYASGVFAAGR